MKKIANFFSKLLNKFVEMSIEEADLRIAYLAALWQM